MGKAGVILSLFVVGFIAHSAFCNDDKLWNLFSDRESEIPFRLQPILFQAGQEYSFEYNGQVSSGLLRAQDSQVQLASEKLNENVENSENGEKQQKAVLRIRSDVKIIFNTDHYATLRLEKTLIGRLNNVIGDPKLVKPMRMFKQKSIDEKKERELQLPVQFHYIDGVINFIQFHPEDMPWSRNVKRAVLNLIQINLNSKNLNSDVRMNKVFSEERNQVEEKLRKAFTVPEITIEGECLTTYTVSEKRRQEQNEKLENRDEQQINELLVTKSINFKQCKRIADVAYGFQSQAEQTVKCAHINAQKWEQFGNRVQNEDQYQFMDEESCDPKEVNDDKLDRSSIQRFELVRMSDNKFGIKRAEALSHYMLKNIRADSDEQSPGTMHTVAITELIFRNVKPSANSAKAAHYQLKQLNDDVTENDSLLFDNEWEIKRKLFLMYGDDETSRENSPYRTVEHKVEQAKTIYHRLILSSTDNINGMEVNTISQLQRLVEILRMCSVNELENIFEKVQENQQKHRVEIEKMQQLLADTFAIAGTRNTVYVLTQKINKNELSPSQAAQALRSLHGIPAPSDAITSLVAELCKNEMAYRSPTLHQACWLTFGAMVGEICHSKVSVESQQEQKQWSAFSIQPSFEKTLICPQVKKEYYQQILLHQYYNAETTYDKVLILKAIGNAGLDTIVNEIEQIVNGQNEQQAIVRIVAIDALRRLRIKMPRKIQRVCLPIFQSTNEQSEIRMAALSILVSTKPEQHILDQILYTLSKERSIDVLSLTHALMNSMSKSMIPQEQQIAKHLQSALKLAKIDEELLQSARASNRWQLPLYTAHQQEGVLLKWISIFADNQMLPVHMAGGLDTFLNGNWQHDTLKVSLSQQGTNRWIENLMQTFSVSEKHKSRAFRKTAVNQQRSNEKIGDIISRLATKSRNNNQKSQKQEAYIMVSARLNDVDFAVLPINEHNLPQHLKKVLENGEKLSFSSIIAEIGSSVEKRNIHWLSALNINEKHAIIPTLIGFPLKVMQSTPMLSYVEAGAKVQPKSDGLESYQIKTEVKAHAVVTLVHMQNMELWTPFMTTGVQSVRGVELNAPMHLIMETEGHQQNDDNQNGLLLTWKIPQSTKIRIFGAHTMCSTFIDNNKNKEIRVIHDPILRNAFPVVEINKVYSENIFGMPIHVNGHFHLPRKMFDYASIAQILMATENHIHIELEQGPNIPREIVLHVSGSLFQKTQAQLIPELKNFYANAEKQFLLALPKDIKEMELDEITERRQKLSKTLERLQKQQSQTEMYKHSLRFSIEANGRKKTKTEMKLQAVCDAKAVYCEMVNEIQRTPVYADETSTWTLKQKIQILAPESVSSIQELEQLHAQKNDKFFVQMENEWRTQERTQFINVRIHGENAQTKKQRQWLDETSNKQKQSILKRAAAFINKYDIVSDYKLNAYAQSAIQRVFEVLKSYYFWNTESHMEQTGRDGQLFASIIISPVTQRQINVSIRTPTQTVRIVNAQLPMNICPMPLVRASQRPTHSISQALSRYTTENRVECRADGRHIKTFDGVFYKTSITKCYSVLAKDCANVKQPKFIVLMKSISEDGQQKKIKVITSKQIIECQPQQQTQIDSWKNQKIACSINGQEITAEQQLMALSGSSEEQNSILQIVEYNNDEQTSVTINANGASVRFGCQCANCDCQRVWIKLSDIHKNTQCGLCGHYDDTLADEWRMNNNELTNDLGQFHRSYTLQDDEECSESNQSVFYNNNKKQFRVLNNDRYQNMEQSNESSEELQQRRFGNYAQEDESNEEWKKSLNFNQKWQNNQEIIEPKMRTVVLEQMDNICFSTKPVKQCPMGTMNEEEEEEEEVEEEEEEKNNENVVSVEFACLPRLTYKAHRLQNDIRRGNVVDVSSLESQFNHKVLVPAKCVRYY